MYILKFSKEGSETTLELRGDYNTEQILRGLLHEGFTITLREEREREVPYPDNMIAGGRPQMAN